VEWKSINAWVDLETPRKSKQNAGKKAQKKKEQDIVIKRKERTDMRGGDTGSGATSPTQDRRKTAHHNFRSDDR
jgi:hypothetical protein